MSALLKPDESYEMKKLKIEIPSNVMESLDRFMTYAKINTPDSAITKALEYVMEKDKGFSGYCAKL